MKSGIQASKFAKENGIDVRILSEMVTHLGYQDIIENMREAKQACRQFLRNLPGPPSPRKGQKLATSMPPAALDVLVPLDLDPHTGLKIYAPQ